MPMFVRPVLSLPALARNSAVDLDFSKLTILVTSRLQTFL